MCPQCRRPLQACACGQAARSGLRLAARDTLRSACGSGGTLKDGVLEVQGDHAERVVNLLQQDGFVVKRAGG